MYITVKEIELLAECVGNALVDKSKSALATSRESSSLRRRYGDG